MAKAKKPTNDPLTVLQRHRDVTANGCWEWTRARDAFGYGKVQIANRKWLAHRLAWTVWQGPIADGRWILHRCDNPACFNPSHLYEGTPRDNSADMLRKGRDNRANAVRGETHGQAKLTTDDVLVIRQACADITNTMLAHQLGVSRSLIGLIRNGRIWTHVHA